MESRILERFLIVILTIGFIAMLGHEVNLWGPQKEVTVVNNLQKEAVERLLHRVWIDHPSYVEDALCETDEFLDLSVNYDSIFYFKSIEDSIEYFNNVEVEQTKAQLYLRYYREPDTIPAK